ncbi:MAG: RagB/SusD family nutrient uptake outer membrane protein [Paludibacteraceae bacterium]|nr:RagB/SusD family nutrient uptake outer membrane protein [Paludibacteraceae bacterium]
MKKIVYIFLAFCLFSFSSCDWVSEPTPGVTQLSDYFVSGQACIYNVNANYVPLAWEYNKTYYSEWFIGDVMSDDALKGGQNISDMAAAYELENFKSNADNEIAEDFYKAQYEGIARCNLSLHYIPTVECDSDMNEALKERLLGECYFLRAYYYFRLVRTFGGVPLTLGIENDDSQWNRVRESAETIYTQIISDLEAAESRLWNKSQTGGPDMGRATKGAAQAMLVKVNMYRHNYAEAKKWGDKFLEEQATEYSLVPDFASNFTIAGENNAESIFEIQYANEGTSDFSPGNGATRGTFTTVLTRSRSTNMGDEGWGFNKPTWNLYNEYEKKDSLRRNATIILLDADHLGDQDTYLGTSFLNRKTGLYNADGTGYTYKNAHNTRGVLNNKQIRLADLYLLYAEACEETGDVTNATFYLNEVRNRAGLDPYPGYTFEINGEEVTSPTLKEAIRHERRMELAMEGHRWFDLCRWGVAYEVMTAYMAQESPEAKAEMQPFKKGIHELLPIPNRECQLNSLLIQNNGY